MFYFFQNIFSKVVSLMASIIVAVGLVFAPTSEIPKQPLPQEQPKEEIILETEQKESMPEKQPEIKPEAKINEQHEAESQTLEEKIRQADIEIAELERQRIEDEKRAESRTKAEAQIQAEAETQRKAEETAQKEYEAQTIQKIESDINHFSDLISSVNQKIEQLASAYRAGLDRERISYLNQTDSYTSIYKPSLTRRHREILNEASKGIWTDCSWLRDLWDYQSGDYQQYSTVLNNAERTLKSNIDFVAGSYIPDFNFYLNQINKDQSIHIPTKEKLNQYLNQLNGLSISGVETFKNEVRNLISELNSLESKINDAKSYSFSYPLASSFLSGIDPLIQEEKAWFAKTSCQNLP